MPGWIAAHQKSLPLHPSRTIFWISLFVLVLLVSLVTELSLRKGKKSVWSYLWFGSVVTVLVNAIVPHLAATLIFWQYTPGVITAVAINLPLMSFLLVKAIREGWVSGPRCLRYAVLTPIAVGGFLVLLFSIR